MKPQSKQYGKKQTPLLNNLIIPEITAGPRSTAILMEKPQIMAGKLITSNLNQKMAVTASLIFNLYTGKITATKAIITQTGAVRK